MSANQYRNIGYGTYKLHRRNFGGTGKHLLTFYRGYSKNILYVSIAAVASLTVVKGIIKARKEAKFTSAAMAQYNADDQKSKEYYANSADVKPGFPLPRSESEFETHKRKSKYEGTGMSVLSRRRGDRLGFFDRRSDE